MKCVYNYNFSDLYRCINSFRCEKFPKFTNISDFLKNRGSLSYKISADNYNFSNLRGK